MQSACDPPKDQPPEGYPKQAEKSPQSNITRPDTPDSPSNVTTQMVTYPDLVGLGVVMRLLGDILLCEGERSNFWSVSGRGLMCRWSIAWAGGVGTLSGAIGTWGEWGRGPHCKENVVKPGRRKTPHWHNQGCEEGDNKERGELVFGKELYEGNKRYFGAGRCGTVGSFASLDARFLPWKAEMGEASHRQCY